MDLKGVIQKKTNKTRTEHESRPEIANFHKTENLYDISRHSQIKVIQLISNLSMGGAQALAKDYCLTSDKDTEMVVVNIGATGNFANERVLREAGVKVISVEERLGWCKLPGIVHKIARHLVKFYFCPRELKKIIREEKPDCIHMHMAVLRYLMPAVDGLKGIRLFHTCHNYPELCYGYDSKGKKEEKAARCLIETAGLRLIALHPDMADELNARFGVSNTVVVKNGINFRRFSNVSINKSEMRERLSIPEDAFVVGHVGRFAPQKNHAFLAEVFYELTKRMDNAFLLMVGEGSLKEEVLNKLDHLCLSGKYLCLKNRGDIPELMNAMDVFVFPSIYEGLGNVLIEAQVSGLRCVISEIIPKEVLLTKDITPVSLEKTPAEWSDIIMDNSIYNDHICGKLEDYDMEKAMEHLGLLYRGLA